MITTHKYQLEKYTGRRSRYTCPGCGKPNEFTLYLDTETGEALAPHVGKCNRANKCGYHYKPGDFFRDNPDAEKEIWKQSDAWQTVYTPPPPPPVDFLPAETLRATLKAYDKNNFFRYLVEMFGQQKAQELAQAYHLGTSKKWAVEADGFAVIFWQVDKAGNIRQAKAMAYNQHTGRRLKEDGKSYVAFLGKQIAGEVANLQQCFFGEHLLSQHPEAPVCLVESEKTAVIMAALMPGPVWLATGGKNGAKWTDPEVYQALEGRNVILYPDLGAYQEWQDKGKILATVCAEVSTSDLLERHAAGNDWQEGYDLADYFTRPPQEAPGSHEAGRLEEETAQAQQTPQEAGKGLPAGFSIVGNVLEVDGLPMGWLNDDEHAAALERLAGRELEVMALLYPNVGRLVGRFELAGDR